MIVAKFPSNIGIDPELSFWQADFLTTTNPLFDSLSKGISCDNSPAFLVRSHQEGKSSWAQGH
jgi:hypothetical protein